jgi:YHS domain-containing protein
MLKVLSLTGLALVLTTSYAAHAGMAEYGKMCTMGLASGKEVQTDCSVNAQVQGKTYCFSSQSALTQFMADPSGNLAKAQAYYSKMHPG